VILAIVANLVLAIAASVVEDLVLAVTITSVAVTGLFGVLLTRLKIENLFEVTIELSEAFLVFLVEKHTLDVPVLVQPMVQLGE